MPSLSGTRPWLLATTVLTSRTWITGAALLGVGAAVQTAALTGLPLAVLAGLGMLLILAVPVLGERLTPREWGCVLLAATATALFVHASTGLHGPAGLGTPAPPLVVAVALPSLLVPYLYVFVLTAVLAMGLLQIALQRSRLVIVGLVATATAKTYLLIVATPLAPGGGIGCWLLEVRTMDPRRIALNRRHSREMGLLFARFLDAHPDVESEVHGAQMTDEQEAAWTEFSAALLRRHQAERAALANVLEAEARD